MRSFTALAVVMLAAGVSANTIPLTKVKFNGSPGATDRSRASLLKSRAANGQTAAAATNQVMFYTTSVGIGSPPTYYNLLIDTASSNTWCGANGKPYNRTTTSIPTGQSLNITYGSGNLTGLEYLDQVTVAPGLVVANQSIGDALSYVGLQRIEGVIGLGPVDLTNHTVASHNNTMVPTIMNNLASQGLIKNQILGVYLAPYSGNDSDANGALTYGWTDPSLYQGEVTYVPLTDTFPSSYYWGINVTSAAYGNYTIIPGSTAGIVDAGTTQVLLADDFFGVYMNAIPGATFNSTIDLIQIPNSSVQFMHPLDFRIADKVFTLDVAAQLVPQDQTTEWGGTPGQYYSVVGPTGYVSGQGLDYALGMVFMERYYTVFDADNRRVGFAQTNNTLSPSPCA